VSKETEIPVPIPHNRPLITDDDRAAVAAVLGSGWVAQGPKGAGLERAISALNGGGDACLVSSGTAALFLALRGLGVGAGEAVAVPSYACSALLNAVVLAGGRPVPVDVRPNDFTIDPERLDSQAPGVRFVIAVHTYGTSAPVEALASGGRIIIEDCCQSLGGPDRHPENTAVYSFHATKIITGGQGGVVWDRSGRVAADARDFRAFDGRQTWTPGINFLLSDLNAALALSQLGRLPAIRTRRRAIRAAYERVRPRKVAVQAGLDRGDIMPYRYVLRFPNVGSREAAREAFAASGVGVAVPIERFELLHRYLGVDPAGFPVAESLADTTLSLPLHLGLSDDDVVRVTRVLERL
jgi:dTDP-4-amino-4,6-dideoxygalactose transaminase